MMYFNKHVNTRISAFQYYYVTGTEQQAVVSTELLKSLAAYCSDSSPNSIDAYKYHLFRSSQRPREVVKALEQDLPVRAPELC